MNNTHRRVRSALNNHLVRDTLDRFTATYMDQRSTACSRIDFTSAREYVTNLRRDSIQQLDELKQQFIDRATSAGARVHVAADAAAARRLILDCAARHGVSHVIKSKSMTTDEIGLNDALISSGRTVTETDLGEWILQLAGQRPSHMVMPAIHMNADQVAQVFSQHLNRPVAADRRLLVDTAREELRKLMVSADMGVTGANMAIANTGTLVLVTNEGNGRFVTTYPPVHAVVVGIDRLIPDMDAMCRLLEVLPRCASGQAISSYVSMFTGPRPGLRELLIILVDNGRTQMAADPELRQALSCIRCCSCLNVCPVYKEIGGHAFGSTYFGGIGVLLELMLTDHDSVRELQSLCLACGRCTEFCPVGIDIAGLIETVRHRYSARIQDRVIASVVGSRGTGPGMISRITRPLFRPFTDRQTKLVKLPVLNRFFGKSHVPAPAPRSLTEHLRGRTAQGPVVALFSGCLVGLCFTDIGIAMYDVLTTCGYRPVIIDGCCGSALSGTGCDDRLQSIARYNLNKIAAIDPAAVITPCPSCTRMIRDKYPQLLPADADASGVAAITVDFIQFCHNQNLSLSPHYELRATYHDSCHLLRRSDASTVPRDVLQQVSGLTLIEQGLTAACCGFAGKYVIDQPQISTAVLRNKITSIRNTEAQAVIVDCPGCMLQIRTGLIESGHDLPVLHTAQVLSRSSGNN